MEQHSATANEDVFGGTRSQTGDLGIFRFTGEQHDDATGLIYLRARYAHLGLGRFLSQDSVQPNAPGTQGYNLYAYVANNPTTWVDPTGHSVTYRPSVPAVAGPGLAAIGIQVAAIFSLIAYKLLCALHGTCVDHPDWDDLRDRLGSSSSAGTFSGDFETLRNAAQTFPPTGNDLRCATGAVANMASGLWITSLTYPQHPPSTLDLSIDAALGCVTEQTSNTTGAGGTQHYYSGSGGKVPTTAFGRSVKSLEKQLETGSGEWRLLSAHAEEATSPARRYRGGVSTEEVYIHVRSGEQLVRHIVVRNGEIIHETFRPVAKFGAP